MSRHRILIKLMTLSATIEMDKKNCREPNNGISPEYGFSTFFHAARTWFLTPSVPAHEGLGVERVVVDTTIESDDQNVCGRSRV